MKPTVEKQIEIGSKVELQNGVITNASILDNAWWGNDGKIRKSLPQLNEAFELDIDGINRLTDDDGNDIPRQSDILTIQKQDFWAKTTFLQLQSTSLQPHIDYTSVNVDGVKQGGYSSVFARLPLIAVPVLGSSSAIVTPTYGDNIPLSKDSLMYQIKNNPNALSNGTFHFRVLDQDGNLIPSQYLDKMSFTLVVYKPRNTYN